MYKTTGKSPSRDDINRLQQQLKEAIIGSGNPNLQFRSSTTSGTPRQYPIDGASADDRMDFITSDEKSCDFSDIPRSILYPQCALETMCVEERVAQLESLVCINSQQVVEYLRKHPQWIEDMTQDMTAEDSIKLLNKASQYGHIDTVEHLTEYCGFEQHAPIHYAAQFNSISTIEKLLSRSEIDPNIEDYGGRTALYYAVANNHISIVEKLLSHRKCIIKTEGRKNILDAIKNYDIDPACVKLLQQHPSWSESVNQQFIKIMKEKASANSNVAEKNHFSDIPGYILYPRCALETMSVRERFVNLKSLVGRNSQQVVEYLTKDPQWIKVMTQDMTEEDRKKVLNQAAEKNHIDTVEHLINYCGFECGDPPIHYAAKYNCISAVEKLLSRPEMDPNIEDNDGRTALYYAAVNNHISILENLLSHPKCIIKTEGRKNILDAIKNYSHKINPKTVELIAYYSDPKDLEFFKQYVPWLEDLHNGKFQSIKDDIEKYGLPTKNLKKFISKILDYELIENYNLASALREIQNLQPSDSIEKKLLGFIKCKECIDKYLDSENISSRGEIGTDLKRIFCSCIREGDFQSIHGLASLGLTNKNLNVESMGQYRPEYDEVESFAGEIPHEAEVLDAMFKSRFLNKWTLHCLYHLIVLEKQQELAKICHKYGGSVAFFDIDKRYSGGYRAGCVSEIADKQCVDKAINKMKERQWDQKFIDAAENRGRVSLESGATI